MLLVPSRMDDIADVLMSVGQGTQMPRNSADGEARPLNGWLATILGGMSLDTFEAEHLDHEMAFLPGQPERFVGLLPWPELNRLLETTAFTRHTLRMAMGGTLLPTSDYLTEKTNRVDPVPMTRVKARDVTDRLRKGATLIINDISALSEPIRTLQTDIQNALDANVAVNMYASLCDTSGFSRHWDPHDVLILQVHGSKRWQLFGQRVLQPVNGEAMARTEQPALAEPTWDRVLRQGDALYLPRGYWHLATPVGEPTVHLTVSIVQPNGLDYVEWIFKSLRGEALLRKTVPWRKRSEAEGYLHSVRELVVSSVSRTDTLDMFKRDVALATTASRCVPRFGLPWSAMNDLPPSIGTNSYVYLVSQQLAVDVPPSRAVPAPSDLDRPVELLHTLCDYLRDRAPVRLGECLEHLSVHAPKHVVLELLGDLAARHVIDIRS